jgi:hypothetical protein
MTKREKYAYAAGIIDGEGCIGVYSFGHKKNLYPQLNVTSTDKELCEWLRDLFERGRICEVNRSGQRRYWRWDCVGNAALDVLLTVEPYLVIDRKRKKVNCSLMSGLVIAKERAVAEFQTIPRR